MPKGVEHMSNDLICTWLGLPPGCWPPDHYRLLGLEPGEDDVHLIEQRVHQRLDSVRRYQMMYPEQATEAMNRLAQAFVCLTEPSAKRVYDAELLGSKITPPKIPPPRPREQPAQPPGPSGRTPRPGDPRPEPVMGPPPLPPIVRAPPPLPPSRPPDAPRVQEPTPEAPEKLLVDQPPPRPEVVAEPVAVVTMSSPGASPSPAPTPAPHEPPAPTRVDPEANTHADLQGDTETVPSEAREPVDEVLLLARSPAARRGLGTRWSLLRRRTLTHRLLLLWGEAEHFFEDPGHRPSRPEATACLRLVQKISDALEDFPPLLGEAGQPGHLLLALAERETARDILKLDAHQRESLQRDCKAGLKLLRAHRDFLREEMRAVRRRGWRERWFRAIRSFVNERPALAILTLLGLLALVIALGRTHE
jgi:hypothetical protein